MTFLKMTNYDQLKQTADHYIKAGEPLDRIIIGLPFVFLYIYENKSASL